MENDQSFATEVWLLSGIINSLPGILTLENNRLILTAIGSGTFWESGLKKIEKKSGVENFFSLINKGKPVQLFNVDLSEIQKLSFPWFYFMAGAHITCKKAKYRLSFIQPNNSVIPILDRSDFAAVYTKNVEIIQDIKDARKVGRKWKLLLTQ